jgi:hypothetical protein
VAPLRAADRRRPAPGIRARVPLAALRDTIRPFASFSEIQAFALNALQREIATASQPIGAT